MKLDFTRDNVRALENCSYCPRLCHFACPTAHGEASETASPWGMMSIVNMLRKGQIEPDKEVVRDLYRCTSCWRCTAFCCHGNPVADILADARGQLMSAGFEPAEVSALQQTGRLAGTPEPIRDDVLALLMDRSGESAGIGYFPGCESGNRPASRIEQTLDLLARLSGSHVGLAASVDALCCGQWAGRAGLAADRRRISERLAEVGGRYHTVISACSGLTELPGATRVVPLREYLAGRVDALEAEAQAAGSGRRVTLHGGCNPRTPMTDKAPEEAILEAIGVGVDAEHVLAGQSECCGGDILYQRISPEGARAAAAAVIEGSRADGAALATVSDRCARHMSEAGERVDSVLDLVLERCSTRP